MHAIASDWHQAQLDSTDRALCAYAEQLTRTPRETGPEVIEELRSSGLDDRSIHDATQIIGFFNYINRMADALGVELEDFVRNWGEADGQP